MIDKATKVLLAVLVGVLGLSAAPAAAADDPVVLMREREQEVHKILTDPSVPDTAKQNMVMEKVSEVFDYVELARRSLAGHWNRLTGKQRTEFTGTLQQLIERSIVSKLKPNKEYSVDVETAKVQGSEAELPAFVATPETIPGDEVELQFRLYRTSQGWVVYDMIIDEVSLLNNYRLQFNKIISENSFDHLMTQMKQKLAAEQEAEKTAS